MKATPSSSQAIQAAEEILAAIEDAREIKRLRAALVWISEYWLGPTAVCQVHVDHMKGIARRALGWPHV